MASILIFLLIKVFTRPAFVMLLNPRSFSLLILELFFSPYYANLVLPIVNWPQLQLTEFKTSDEMDFFEKGLILFLFHLHIFFTVDTH